MNEHANEIQITKNVLPAPTISGLPNTSDTICVQLGNGIIDSQTSEDISQHVMVECSRNGHMVANDFDDSVAQSNESSQALEQEKTNEHQPITQNKPASPRIEQTSSSTVSQSIFIDSSSIHNRNSIIQAVLPVESPTPTIQAAHESNNCAASLEENKRLYIYHGKGWVRMENRQCRLWWNGLKQKETIPAGKMDFRLKSSCAARSKTSWYLMGSHSEKSKIFIRKYGQSSDRSAVRKR